MKKNFSLIIVIALGSLNVHAADPLETPSHPPQLSKPTWGGDEHDQPVFTSPTNSPAMTNLPADNNLPPMTNRLSTNLPAMTNPPVLQPPTGLAIVQ